MSLLVLKNVSRRFGGLFALDDVSLSLGQGEVVGLIGPNGAGKTTFVNVVTGVLKPSSGSIEFAGHRIDGLRPDRISRSGIARTFQIVQPFPRLSVRENVAAAALFAGGVLRLGREAGIAVAPRLDGGRQALVLLPCELPDDDVEIGVRHEDPRLKNAMASPSRQREEGQCIGKR